ncbi:hypothetical protein HYV21_00655 [Candidatus Microgenomates bacterium]|nr:hypothetical protein [Candidatus Microgenomates bacterium]
MSAQPTIRERLKLRHLEEQKKLAQKHPHALEFFTKKALPLSKIRDHSAKALAAGALAGTLALTSPADKILAQAPALPPPVFERLLSAGMILPENPEDYLKNQLDSFLPERPRPLTNDAEKNIGLLIERLTGIKARGTLEGEHLNTTYGYIGAEQHLPRFPGDTIFQHDEFRESGITLGRGAWGYFAPSRAQLTDDLIKKEKYYAVVQTMYLPDWERRLSYLRDWYKYRKVIMINTENGKAVVAAIADSGPAVWTGKQFGGSPEVMNELGGPRYKKGRVLLFFVDDPQNQVPLGPVEYTKLGRPMVASE